MLNINWYKIAQGYYGTWARAFWVDPKGEAIETGGGDTHHAWAWKSNDFLMHNYDIDMQERAQEVTDAEAYDAWQEEIKRLKGDREIAVEDEEPEEVKQIDEQILRLEMDGLQEYEESASTNFNWGSFVVDELLKENWIRAVDKGTLYIEVADLENVAVIRNIEQFLFGLDLSNTKPVVIEQLFGPKVTLRWGDYINVGQSLNDFLDRKDLSWSHGHGVR